MWYFQIVIISKEKGEEKEEYASFQSKERRWLVEIFVRGMGLVGPAGKAAWKWPLSFGPNGRAPGRLQRVAPLLAGALYWAKPCTGGVRRILRT